MATFTPAWTEGITLHSSSTITTGNSTNDNFDLKDISGGPYFGAVLQIDLNIASGSPAGDVTIEFFGSADGGSNNDSIAFSTMRVPFSGTGNKKISRTVYLMPHVNVKVSNATGVDVTYVGRASGLKQSSA